jgi:hypothetical protein
MTTEYAICAEPPWSTNPTWDYLDCDPPRPGGTGATQPFWYEQNPKAFDPEQSFWLFHRISCPEDGT